METAELIRKLKDFLELNYHAKMLEKIRKGESFLVIDFSDLMLFDPDIAELLLDNPEDVIKTIEMATQEFDIATKFKIRISNLPESQRIEIRNIRSVHIGKLFMIDGIVRQKSDVRPQVTSARFECPSCGNIINVLQLDSSFKEPSRCGCGRKGKFRMLSKELVDAQGIVLEEVPEHLEGGAQPKRINVLLKDDLVSPMSERRTNPGATIKVIGQLKEIPIILRTGIKSIRFDLMIEANYVEAVQETFYEFEVTPDEERQILEIANDKNVYERLIKSMAPSIFGYDRVKEALLLQMIGGIQKTRKDGVVTRGDIHVLLVGDPGSGKSALLRRINIVSPKSRYVSGKGISAAGLTATVVKDEFLRGWSLEAGAMVLASDGLCCTTGDAEFITRDYKKITFEELFKNTKKKIIFPDFMVLALNTENNKIEPFKIKKAFKIKNNKGVYKIKTRTGREINLTEDNEVLVARDSEKRWVKVLELKKGDYIAVQNKFPSKYKLMELNQHIQDKVLAEKISGDILWDKVIAIKEINAEYVYDFTMAGTNNFIANDIIMHNCIDELDKMNVEDRAAMHEAMENQSYHPDTEIMLSNGHTQNIGNFVDGLIEKNQDKVIKGKNCEILPVKNIKLLTTDFKKIFPVNAKVVSRHLAPEYFIKILFGNGRELLVTPEHPVYIFENGKICVKPAAHVKEGCLVPCPRSYPTKKERIALKTELILKRRKSISFPKRIDEGFARLLGYIVTEGHCYYHEPTRYAEVGVSNTNKRIIDEVDCLFKRIFKSTTNINLRVADGKKAKKNLFTVRCCSIPLWHFFRNNFPGLVCKSSKKRAPHQIKVADAKSQQAFLQAAFLGDGFISTEGFGFITSSYGLAKDYQDLLLQMNIWSTIRKEVREKGNYFKAIVSGTGDLGRFADKIVSPDDKRKQRIVEFCKRSMNRRNSRNPLTKEVIEKVVFLLNEYRLNDGYFWKLLKKNQNSHREVVLEHLKKVKDRIELIENVFASGHSKKIRKSACLSVSLVSKKLGVSNSMVYYLERTKGRRCNDLVRVVLGLAKDKIKDSKQQLKELLDFINSDIRFLRIRGVERVKNNGIKWVYDVTVEPTRTFLSEGLVLHNTVSISKANIQATLIARTTVLAAANPKLGRFDPYDILAKQIDLPPTLINRFDLIFPIKDLPEEARDLQMAGHILGLHQNPDMQEPEIPTSLLKRYIAYARQRMKPYLTDGALEEIKTYYVEMRNKKGVEEGAARAIPISPRQLEALVRLSEASAKTRFSNKVTKKDARRAIDLLHYCLNQIGVDPETGKIDIDRITTGIPASQRNKIIQIREIIEELENSIGKTIPIDDIVKEARARNIAESDVDESIERLKRSGDLFEPKRGFVSRI